VSFPSIGDPRCSIVDEIHNRKLLQISLSEDLASEVAKDNTAGGKHERAVIQPAILALDSNFNVLYRWASEPTWKNLNGAIQRPAAKDVLAAVLKSKTGDFTSKEGDSSKEASVPFFIMPLFLLALLANGNFLDIRPFVSRKSGKFSTPALQMVSSLVKLGVVSASLVTVWRGYPEWRVLLGSFLTAYVIAAYCFLNERVSKLFKPKVG
jgi:hypothetical protein